MNVLEHYFEWLCDKIGYDEYYDELLHFLFEKEYIWIHPMDENRAVDGLWLRRVFMSEEAVRGDPFEDKPCSVLEVFIRLTYRMEEEIMGDPDLGIFWRIIHNLGLDETGNKAVWNEIIDNWMNGEIEYNGTGGPFPLKNPLSDQRGVELWGQAMDYLNEIE